MKVLCIFSLPYTGAAIAGSAEDGALRGSKQDVHWHDHWSSNHAGAAIMLTPCLLPRSAPSFADPAIAALMYGKLKMSRA
jgi:hypothetical protein